MNRPKILLDEMHDWLDDELKKRYYDVESVTRLVAKGEKVHSDYSIVKRAEQKNMILVTEDDNNVDSCLENNILCVRFGQHDVIEYLVVELEKIYSGLESKD